MISKWRMEALEILGLSEEYFLTIYLFPTINISASVPMCFSFLALDINQQQWVLNDREKISKKFSLEIECLQTTEYNSYCFLNILHAQEWSRH